MFAADVLTVDESVLIPQVAIAGRDSRRGNGSPVWRGFFRLPSGDTGRLKMGDTLYLKLSDNSRIGAVVTEVAAPLVHLLTAVESGGGGRVSRRSKLAAHKRAVL